MDSLPCSSLYEDVYYSVHGGIEQSRYVFVDGNRLIERWTELPADTTASFNIAETGFGTGLNFLLTWHLWLQHAPEHASLHFISCELHPLSVADLTKALSVWPELAPYAQQLIEQYPVLTPGNHHLIFAKGRVQLTLMLGDAFSCYEQLLVCADSSVEHQLRSAFIDAWYLDGFAPSKNAQMWSDQLFTVITLLSKEHTTVATYTVAATVIKQLTEHGFTVVKKKGFARKKEMLTAHLSVINPLKLKQRTTPWHMPHRTSLTSKSAIIVGAGLAGCFMARSLAERGWRILLLEARDKVGSAGSANEQAVLFPKLSAYRSPFTAFMLSAFLFAHDYYKKLLKEQSIGALIGCFILADELKEYTAQQSLQEWLNHYPELGQLLNAEQASMRVGVALKHGGLFIPRSGWLNSPALCERLIEHDRIEVRFNTQVSALDYDEDNWFVAGYSAPIVIIATADKANALLQTQHVPIKPIRGQMTSIDATPQSALLKVPLCAQGHILPLFNGVHHLGATYTLGVAQDDTTPEDDLLNLQTINKIASNSCWSNHVVGHWAGVRASTPDYLPLVGPVAKKDEFLRVYQGLESNSNRWIAAEAPYHPGLYLCAGFGSRGLTTIPLCVQWLSSLINQEFCAAPRYLLHALSPSRFLRRTLFRSKPR